MNTIYLLDLLGTFIFAISGTATAADKKFDLFGATIIALVTAVGGGTIRDLLIGSTPVGWMKDLNYLAAIGLGVAVTFFFKNLLVRLRHTLFLFDAIGIGLFTILGLQKTLAAGLSPVMAVLMGTVSAVFGGVVRDILCNEVPLIFRKEIYATACMAGALLYCLLEWLGLQYHINVAATVAFIIVVRVLAVRRGWGLPVVK
ncbi:MAG: trimeric intracellular cation channel family protein [Bacteroidetes bacterium]|nr:trimeric intracellular cation channel family protein [Bacteroidota bacterium]